MIGKNCLEEPSQKRSKFFVYLITNKDSGSVYVGKSVDPNYRWSVHRSLAKNEKRCKSHFHKAIRLYGSEKFDLEIVFESSSEDEAFSYEEMLTKKFRLEGISLYNEKDGGRGGHSNPSPELREKLSIAKRGSRHPLWGKPSPMLGIKRSEESIRKFKLTVRNRLYGKCGHSFSDETRLLMSNRRRGQKFHGKTRISDEERLKIIELFCLDKTATEIAAEIDRCKSSIHRIIKTYIEKTR